ncbi:hypothetical protein BGP77_11500 [Saccharospirillum sp. MSK14-1]|nr:hypothetical protein BGP77_11500 [Saccharospirillum sp. MSK14-1]
MKVRNKNRKNLPNLQLFLWVIGILSALPILLIVLQYRYSFPGEITLDHEKWAQFGDFFGGTLNPILGFLSFIALLVTIYFQRQEIQLTRIELVKSTEAQKESANALKEQVQFTEIQKFENTFYSMLSHLQKIEESINILTNQRERSSFSLLLNEIDYLKVIDTEVLRNKLNYQFDRGQDQYFIFLYQILKFVNENLPRDWQLYRIREDYEMDVKNHMKRYTNIVRASISQDALKVLLLRCSTTSEDDLFFKYRNLLTDFRFFEHLKFRGNGELIGSIFEASLNYHKCAFGNSHYLKEFEDAFQKRKKCI